MLLDKDLLINVLDYSPCTISWVGRDMKYIGVNKKLEEVTGLKKEDFIGKKVGEVIKDKTIQELVEEVFVSKEEQLTRLFKNNLNKYFYIVAKRININYAIIIGLDVTELKENEASLILNEKLITMGELAFSVVHELKNPISMIAMINENISLMAKNNDLNKDMVIEMTSEVMSLVKRLEDNIITLKTFIHRGNEKEINLFDFMDKINLFIKNNLFKRKIKLIKEIDKNINVKFNDSNLYQVVINLLNNSMDALSESDSDEKWIKIIAKEVSNDLVEFKIQDSGMGIRNPDDLFLKFKTTKKSGAGTGLGLYLSKKIMNEAGNEIFYDKNEKNTTFVLKLNKN